MDETNINHQPPGTLVTMGADNNLQVIGVFPESGVLRVKAKDTTEFGIEYAYTFIFFRGFSGVSIDTIQLGDIIHLTGGVSDNGDFLQISMEPSLFPDATLDVVANDPTIDDPVTTIAESETDDYLPGGSKHKSYAVHTVKLENAIVDNSDAYPYVDLAAPYYGFRLWAFIYCFRRTASPDDLPRSVGRSSQQPYPSA